MLFLAFDRAVKVILVSFFLAMKLHRCCARCLGQATGTSHAGSPGVGTDSCARPEFPRPVINTPQHTRSVKDILLGCTFRPEKNLAVFKVPFYFYFRIFGF